MINLITSPSNLNIKMYNQKMPNEKKLRPICKQLCLSQKGDKEQLVKRLTEYGLSYKEIVSRANSVSSIKKQDAAEDLRILRSQSRYASALPESIHDMPSEKALRQLCKRFGLLQCTNKVKSIKVLLDHGLIFSDIVDMCGGLAEIFTLPSPSLCDNDAIGSSSSFEQSDIDTPPLFDAAIDSDIEEDHFIQEMERLDHLEVPNSTVRVLHYELLVPATTSDTTETLVEPVTLPPPPPSIHTCNVCGKSYAHKRSLTRHMRIHGEWLNLCHVCGKSFAITNLLHRHLKTHADNHRIHPKYYDGTIIALNETQTAFEHVVFNDEVHRCEILQIVAIPSMFQLASQETAILLNMPDAYGKRSTREYVKAYWCQLGAVPVGWLQRYSIGKCIRKRLFHSEFV